MLLGAGIGTDWHRGLWWCAILPCGTVASCGAITYAPNAPCSLLPRTAACTSAFMSRPAAEHWREEAASPRQLDRGTATIVTSNTSRNVARPQTRRDVTASSESAWGTGHRMQWQLSMHRHDAVSTCTSD